MNKERKKISKRKWQREIKKREAEIYIAVTRALVSFMHKTIRAC